VFLDDPALTKILLSHATGMDPAFVSKIRSFYDGVKTMLSRSLAEGQRLGIVAPGDTELFATFAVGALKELLAGNVAGENQLGREEMVAALFSFLHAGYLRTGPDGGHPGGSVAKGAAPPASPHRSAKAGKRR